MDDARAETAAWYRRAAAELATTSALQVDWATGIADDQAALALLGRMPHPARQPSLVFSVARLLGAPAVAYRAGFRDWMLASADALAAAASGRRVQTNEVQRCGPLLAALARIPGPIALLELGAAAGLCLQVDRYSYRFDDSPVLGAGTPRIDVATSGAPLAPTALPEIVWRRGVDLAPLDPADPADRAWLDALLPPDRPDRAARLDAACRTAAAHPVEVRAGDAVDAVPAAFDGAPADATRVVASLGTLVYLRGADRQRVRDACAAADARLITFEPVAALPDVAERADALAVPERTGHLLALDGIPLAFGSPHGDRVFGLAPASG